MSPHPDPYLDSHMRFFDNLGSLRDFTAHILERIQAQEDADAAAAAAAASNPAPAMAALTLNISSTLPLKNTKLKIPTLGFGIYQSPPDVTVQSCITAIQAGYRHIDSAQYYQNEWEMGRAVRESGLPRNQIFLTTKILSAGGSVERSYNKCVQSVEKIDGAQGYVDLFLIHSPNVGGEARKEMWLALEKLHKEGKAKAIGVSNYGIGHIEEMKEYKESVWPPVVNQIELHPWCQQREIVEYCNKNGIVVEAYSPLVRNQKADNETLVAVAKKVGKTTAQVLIRWSLQKGWVTLPKSDTKSRIEANAEVFGWELGEEEMKLLDGLDEGEAGSIVQAVKNTL